MIESTLLCYLAGIAGRIVCVIIPVCVTMCMDAKVVKSFDYLVVLLCVLFFKLGLDVLEYGGFVSASHMRR